MDNTAGPKRSWGRRRLPHVLLVIGRERAGRAGYFAR